MERKSASPEWDAYHAEADMLCEHRPYPGAGYHCYLDAGHDGPHSDLTIQWNDAGRVCHPDGTPI